MSPTAAGTSPPVGLICNASRTVPVFAQVDITSGLILIGVLLLVPLCAAILVFVTAWFSRDGDESPQRPAASSTGAAATPRGNRSTADTAPAFDGQPAVDALTHVGPPRRAHPVPHQAASPPAGTTTLRAQEGDAGADVRDRSVTDSTAWNGLDRANTRTATVRAVVSRILLAVGIFALGAGLFLDFGTHIYVPAMEGTADCGTAFSSSNYDYAAASFIVVQCDTKREDRRTSATSLIGFGLVLALTSFLALARAHGEIAAAVDDDARTRAGE